MSRKHLNVLIVDDDPDHRMLASATLRRAMAGAYNVEIKECDSGTEAVRLLSEGGFDLVFLDYRLPGMDGLEVLSELQSRHIEAPVVFVTSQSDRTTVLEAMKRGAQDFVTKSEFGHARLVQSVHSALERAQLRRDVIRAQKLAAVGTLAGGIAHEFNNILQVVLGHSQYALQADDPERREKALKYCRDAAEKGARIVQQLLSFARKSGHARQRFSLADAVREACSLEQPLMERDGIKLDIVIDASPVIQGDREQLGQVLMNLLSNARHACTSSMTYANGATPNIEISLRVEDGNAVLTVSDNGVGIPPENMARLFEAFFTTKGALGGRVYDGKSAGTGLGLAICANIVADHRGRIDVSSKPGHGSTFSLVLPVASHAREDFPTRRIRDKLFRPTAPLPTELIGKRVLVVDDEEMIGELLRQYLEEKGYGVETATSANLGEKLANEGAYALMLFDLTMPGGFGGKELLERLRAGNGPNRETPALAITGHAPGPGDKLLFEAGFKGILRKPFEIREMGRLIAEAIKLNA
jgi:signal transduction histidine kinase